MISNRIDSRYYVNVKSLMREALPRPTLKRTISVIVNDGEWLPIMDGDTGKVVKI